MTANECSRREHARRVRGHTPPENFGASRIVENASNFVYHRLKRWSVFVNSDKSATYVCFYNTFIKNAIFWDFFGKIIRAAKAL